MADRGHEGAIAALADGGYHGNYYHDMARDDPLLVEAVEALGSENAAGSCARLSIYEIPDGARWEIDEYDANEAEMRNLLVQINEILGKL
jgi:hypothetical protein